jgi:hypothetical protein
LGVLPIALERLATLSYRLRFGFGLRGRFFRTADRDSLLRREWKRTKGKGSKSEMGMCASSGGTASKSINPNSANSGPTFQPDIEGPP